MKKRSSIAVLVVMYLLFAALIAGKVAITFFDVNIGEKEEAVDQTAMVDVEADDEVDWRERYPFADGIEKNVKITAAASKPNKTIVDQYVDVAGGLNSLGNRWANRIPAAYYVKQLGAKYRAIFSKPIETSSYVRFGDNYWVKPIYSKDSLNITDKNIKSLNEYVTSKGMQFLYVQAPTKLCKYAHLPNGKKDYTNDGLDALMNLLDTANIKYVDLRENLHNDGFDHHSMFFDTDHHWKVESAFWAANEIIEAVNEKCAIKMDASLLKEENFRTETYEDVMFASAGQSVSSALADREDLNILFPKFDTDFILSIPDKGINEARGTFEELFVNYKALEEIIADQSGYAYGVLLYATTPLKQITNLNNPDGPRILMIEDSFSLAAAPYLSLACSQLDMIDVRKNNGNFTGSIRTYIDKMQPDLVMILEYIPDRYTWY